MTENPARIAPPALQFAPGESILYQGQTARKWYGIAWAITVGILEAAVVILLSITTFKSLGDLLLAKFLPPETAGRLSRIIFQDLLPVLVIAWFSEDTARVFMSQLTLTNQRLWLKGSPYAWSDWREIPLSAIRSMSFHRDALFIRLKDTKKLLVFITRDGKEIAAAFEKFTGKVFAEDTGESK